MTKDIVETITAYTSTLYAGSAENAVEIAKKQGWLTEDGSPTKSGRDVARAFGDQEKTRSAFRIG